MVNNDIMFNTLYITETEYNVPKKVNEHYSIFSYNTLLYFPYNMLISDITSPSRI